MDLVTSLFLVTLLLLFGFFGSMVLWSWDGSLLVPFLPPLFGSLAGVILGFLVAEYSRSRRSERNRRRRREELLKGIRTELETDMGHLRKLLDLTLVTLIRQRAWMESEKVHTETWDSCIYSGQAIYLQSYERGKINRVYRLLQDYNQRDYEQMEWGHLQMLRHDLADEVEKLLTSESFWPA